MAKKKTVIKIKKMIINSGMNSGCDNRETYRGAYAGMRSMMK